MHQKVWDPETKRLVPVTPYPDDIDPSNLDFCGVFASYCFDLNRYDRISELPDDIAAGVANGILNPITQQPYRKIDDSSSTENSETKNANDPSEVRLRLPSCII